ncbi:MAG: response regulator transcription factor [Planctomycetes bacterium]|nr:response regulator transcription factor [Planctomycetota bacterium]
MKERRIAVIEDEAAIRRGICDMLKVGGYAPVEAADGEMGVAAARHDGVILVLLDLMLPKMDGMQVLEEIRKSHPMLPVIILTARGSENDRVLGLKRGADDYVVKPFSARELLARIEAVLRRTPARPTTVRSVEAGGVRVDFARREVCFPNSERRALSEMEAGILEFLTSNPTRVVTREELLARVWGITADASDTRAVDMHMTRLRTKLTAPDDTITVEWISTVRGKGYMLGPTVAEAVQAAGNT